MFLEILTRCYKRPNLLLNNQASLDSQTSSDWSQTLLIDDVGHGVRWANRRLWYYAPQLEGDYIWILDDDDVCTVPTFVSDLKQIVKKNKPLLIMVRGEIENMGIVPSDNFWQDTPQKYRIGMSNFVVERETFQRYANCFLYDLAGDYSFISCTYNSIPKDKVYWFDKVVMRTQQKGNGKPE
jgi:hypothetical protein